jgi:MSHA biogenesis protein MshN
MAPGEGTIDKQINRPPPQERAEAEYRQGMQAQRQGSADEAVARYRRALTDQPEHVGARQALASLLIEQRRFDDAEAQLRSALEAGAARLTFATMLARLKVERGEPQAALDILLQHSAAGERSADYQGFVAVLQNRAGHHGEAAGRYRAATRLAPNEARWWAGLAIALESDGKPQEAREAYQQARALPGLAPELAAHIEQRLK